ncbi:hypothetical protein RvY_18127-2 [Ramazzottius varieornatus]|nr:hypothetical protein RvY_18127-2 [Ramazzottius varieornatus]
MWLLWRKRCGYGRVATPATLSEPTSYLLLLLSIVLLQLTAHLGTTAAYPMNSYQMYGNGYANTGGHQPAPVNTYADYRMNPASNHYPQYPSPYSVHRDVGWIGGGQPLAALTWPSSSHMSPYSMQPM